MRALPRRRRRLIRVTNLQWNAHANSPSQAGRVIKALDRWTGDYPGIQRVTLTEVKGCWSELAAWCKRNGWAHLQEKGDPDNRADERGDTATLVRTKGPGTAKVLRDRVKPMSERWTVWSHKQVHDPRRHRHQKLKIDRVRFWTASHHGPTRGNTKAVAESIECARRFLTRRGGRVLLDGDLNLLWDDATQLADDTACQIKGDPPDYTITAGRIVEVIKLDDDDGGSDHGAIITTVEL